MSVLFENTTEISESPVMTGVVNNKPLFSNPVMSLPLNVAVLIDQPSVGTN